MTRRLRGGNWVVEGIACVADALRSVRVRQGPDRRLSIDTDVGEPMETAISVNGHVQDITVSRDGEHADVALSKSVTVLNGRHRVVASIPLPDHPKPVDGRHDGKQLIVSQPGSVSVVDTDTHTVKNLPDCFVSDVVVNPDGRCLYAARRQAPDSGVGDVVTSIELPVGQRLQDTH